MASEKRDYNQEILDYLLDNPSGLTITDISEGINTSRITVSKYVGILEAQEEVTNRKIGAYKLYYNANKSLIPKRVMLSYYTGLLSGLKKEITDHEKYKDFGRTIADFMEFPYGSGFPENIKNSKDNYRKYLKYFGKTLPYIDFIYEEKPNIEIIVEENKAIYTLTKISLFDKSENFDVHYFIASGVIERIISKSLQRDVRCNVKEIDPKGRSVKLIVEIND